MLWLLFLGAENAVIVFIPQLFMKQYTVYLFMIHVFFPSSFFAVVAVLGCLKHCSYFYPAVLHEKVYCLTFHRTHILLGQLIL